MTTTTDLENLIGRFSESTAPVYLSGYDSTTATNLSGKIDAADLVEAFRLLLDSRSPQVAAKPAKKKQSDTPAAPEAPAA